MQIIKKFLHAEAGIVLFKYSVINLDKEIVHAFVLLGEKSGSQ